MKNELSIPEQGQLAVRSPDQLMALAIQHGASPETMEKLLALHKEMKAMAAKEAFDKAMADFQSECPVIVKKKSGAKDAYKYAPIDAIISQTKDLLLKFGFSYTFTSSIEQGWLRAVCKVTHAQGHSQESEFKCPVDTKNPMMTEPQRYGGAMTFARRYSFTNAFGIVTADEDTDARDRREQPGFGPQRKKGAGEPEVDSEPVAAIVEPAAASPEGKALASARFAPWKFANASFGGAYDAFERWLLDEGLISDTEDLNTMTKTRAEQVLAEIKAHQRFAK